MIKTIYTKPLTTSGTEELSDILSIGDPSLMRTRLEEWSKLYSSVGISQLTRFTRTVTNRMDGIVSRSTFRINSG